MGKTAQYIRLHSYRTLPKSLLRCLSSLSNKTDCFGNCIQTWDRKLWTYVKYLHTKCLPNQRQMFRMDVSCVKTYGWVGGNKCAAIFRDGLLTILNNVKWSINVTRNHQEESELRRYKIFSFVAIYVTVCGLVTIWHHLMDTFSALLALCEGKLPVTGRFPTQRPVKRSLGAFFDLCLRLLSKQSRRRSFETPSHSIRRHCHDCCAGTSVHTRVITWRSRTWSPLLLSKTTHDKMFCICLIQTCHCFCIKVHSGTTNKCGE